MQMTDNQLFLLGHKKPSNPLMDMVATGTFDLIVFHSGYGEILTLIRFEVCLSRLKLAVKVMSE